MPTIVYRGETVECSDATARHIAKLAARATTDAASRKPPARRFALVLDPTPNAVHDLIEQDRATAVRDAARVAAARPVPGFFTKERREATIAANRMLNEKNRARWAKKPAT